MISLWQVGMRAMPLVAAGLLAGCQTMESISRLKAGPGIEISSTEIAAYSTEQAKVLTTLRVLADQGKTPDAVADWDLVIEAGMGYADSTCETYMQSLFRLNRNRHTVVTEIGLVGTAAAGLMAAAKTAARDVAAVAIGFGLAGSTVDTLSSNVLYDLDPSSVRTMVKELQARFRAATLKGYTTWPGASAVIRAYSVLCVPANIEAEVNLSVKKAMPGTTAGDPAKGQPPTVTNAAPVAQPSGRFGSDAGSQVLRSFALPKGVANPANRKRLEAYLEARQIKASIVSFINDGAFAEERQRAIAFLNLPL